MPYRVTVSARFEAAHNLITNADPSHCTGIPTMYRLCWRRRSWQRHDLAVDFVAAKKALDATAKEFDYKYINEHPAFAGRNTSAENLARYFADRVAASGTFGKARVAEVKVWEGPGNRATLRSGGKPDAQGLIDNPFRNP